MEFFQTQTPIGEVAMRMAMAVAAGLILGIDREAQQKPAELHTHNRMSSDIRIYVVGLRFIWGSIWQYLAISGNEKGAERQVQQRRVAGLLVSRVGLSEMDRLDFYGVAPTCVERPMHFPKRA